MSAPPTSFPPPQFPPLLKPRSVYVHVPFCRHRCGYCNFSVVAGRDYLVKRYLDAIEKEIGWLNDRYEVDTLFLGGGTPSHLSASDLKRLVGIIESRFDLAGDVEFSAECNPNDLDDATAQALAACGVNRISLGVQSLNRTKLESLERDHDREDVRNAVKWARTFARSVSVDLIFAAPGESLADWHKDLDAVLELQPDHLSTYELTYEKGTQFWNRLARQDVSEADEELRLAMYRHAIDRLAEAGLPQYEVSSFASREHRCLHNEIYWSGEPYFAFGPGASSFIDGVRETNHQSTMRYLKLVESDQSPVAQTETLSSEDAARERLAIGLRHVDGVNEQVFQAATGFSMRSILGPHAEEFLEHKLVVHDSGAWRLTQSGRMIYDHVATKIVCG